MGTTPLMHFLKSLCSNSHWEYAVFWKLRHQSPTILTWEAGYYRYLEPRDPVERISGDFYCGDANGIISSLYETSIYDTNSGDCPIRLLVADMSSLQYDVGEGILGRVATTGDHWWVCFDNRLIGVDSRLHHECPEEWLFQLASGIKTIVLVPVIPHGVLQLGSLKEVAEDLTMVAYIRDRLHNLHNNWGSTAPFIFNRDTTDSSSSPLSIFMDNFDDASAVAINPLPSSDSKGIRGVKLDKRKSSALHQVVSLSTVEHEIQVPEISQPEVFQGAGENKMGLPIVGLVEVSPPLGKLMNVNQEIIENTPMKLCFLEEEMWEYSPELGVCHEVPIGTINRIAAGQIAAVDDDGGNEASYHSRCSSFHFPQDSELHKALGLAFQRQTNESFTSSSFSINYACERSSLICNRDFASSIKPSVSDGGAGYLLEAVVANAYSGSEDTLSSRSSMARSSTTSSEQLPSSSQAQSQSEARTAVRSESVLLSQSTSASLSRGKNSIKSLLPSALTKSMMSTLIDKEPEEKGFGYMQPRKCPKLFNDVKRRAKAGDKQRPRPRDRQMIQDRVKELRELVPNGAKCSIDGLLDRTIKHMLYLRVVSDHAEKLRQWVHQEVAAAKDRKELPKVEDNCQKGTSWALELGNQLHVCPIVVEDLAYPGCLLIEMLCNEHGLFLEIAQVIQNAELSILNGVMETRSKNTWAHFIVEASKGFDRMDIFWPLMHLLQQKRSPTSSKI